jgi:hypothetical protein
MEKRAISPGLVRGILGTNRDFLLVTNQENFRLKPYQIFMNARNYGNNLNIAWVFNLSAFVVAIFAALLLYVSVVPSR